MTAPERDEEFEAYLQRRSSLQRELSEHDGLEPPPELDRIVLARARQAIATRPELPVYKPAKWMFPLALAATIVVSFTIVLSMTATHRQDVARSEPELAMDSGSGGQVLERDIRGFHESDLHSDDVVARAETAVAAPSSAYAPPPAAAEKSTPTAPAEAPRLARLVMKELLAAPSAAEAERAEATHVEEPHAQLADADVPDAGPEVAEAPRTPVDASGPADESPRVAARHAPTAPPVASESRFEEVAVTGAKLRAPTRAERRANPDRWLAYIEDLRERGRHSAADRELRAFRKAYPDYPVPPEALRQAD
ncbi:MAG TPA: hypothetical protein VIL32_15735 [Steroidobacteraceae bacterium]